MKSFVLYFQRPSKKGATNDMGKHTKNPGAGARKIETLGGDYAPKWDDETQVGVNAHAALLSQFAKGRQPEMRFRQPAQLGGLPLC